MIAWKVLRVDSEGYLHSPTMKTYVWPVDHWATAFCTANPRGVMPNIGGRGMTFDCYGTLPHDIPEGSSHKCGLYSWKHIDVAYRYLRETWSHDQLREQRRQMRPPTEAQSQRGQLVVAEIELGGKVIIHQAGYRSENARIKSLVDTAPIPTWLTTAAEKYHVLVTLPPRPLDPRS